VRIARLRIDGYGLFSSFELADLDASFTVVLGPNEAGKSTLLDFLRGVLFGFPDRRRSLPYHAPLRGGRHGGAIHLLDEEGQRWTVERYVDARQATITAPDGSLATEEALKRLLGGADDALFRSVFAFGLSELASFETLDQDEVRDLVFSAGVLGAGRSATRAVRELERQQAALARPRKDDARANELGRRLAEVERALAAARAAAMRYQVEAAALRRTSEEVARARDELSRLRRRESELQRLLACAPMLERQRTLRAELAGLEAGSAADARLLERSGEVRALASERSGHGERLAKRRELQASLDGIERERAEVLEQLGPAVDASRAATAAVGAAERSAAEELARRAREERAALGACREALERARERRVRAAVEAGPEPPREARAIEDARIVLEELRSLTTERERLAAQRAQASALSRLAADRARAPARRHAAAAACLALLGAVLVGLAASAPAREGPLARLVVVLGVLVALVAAALALLEARRRPDPGEPAPAAGAIDPDRLATEIERRARSLGLPAAPAAAELEGAARRLDAERRAREQLDERLSQAAEAQRAERAAADAVAAREEALQALRERAAELAERSGLGRELEPEGLERALELLHNLRRLDGARERVADALARLDAEIADFEGRVEALASAFGVDGRLGQDERLAELTGQVENAAGRAARRAEVGRELEALARTLEASLGEGAAARRLRDELERRAREDLEDERRTLDAQLAEAQERWEQLLARERDARRALDELLGSDEVSRLELERATLEAELDAALRRWAVLSLAGHLLEETLARYERERQPTVIRRAAELFRDVTAGRYEQVIARQDPDGRRRGIEVLSAAGQRIDAADLSRGTAEQLYLCLRLALADTFAHDAAALPLVLDDVLVNFDPARARAMAGAIAATAATHQVLAFTCHPHLAELLGEAARGARLVALDPGGC